VRRQHAPWLLLGILILAYGVGRWAGLVIAVFVLGIGYFVSLYVHPRTACRACDGSGRFYGAIYTWNFRMCHACGGNGRKIRFGAARWGSPRVRTEAAAVRSAIQSAERGRFIE
jgi:hypothetical protein